MEELGQIIRQLDIARGLEDNLAAAVTAGAFTSEEAMIILSARAKITEGTRALKGVYEAHLPTYQQL